MVIGTFGYCGFITNGSGSSPIGGGGLVELTGVAGAGGSNPTIGLTTYTNAALVGATGLNFIIVNRTNEIAIGDSPDFTFDSGTGTITRTNTWQDGDTLIILYIPAS